MGGRSYSIESISRGPFVERRPINTVEQGAKGDTTMPSNSLDSHSPPQIPRPSILSQHPSISVPQKDPFSAGAPDLFSRLGPFVLPVNVASSRYSVSMMILRRCPNLSIRIETPPCCRSAYRGWEIGGRGGHKRPTEVAPPEVLLRSSYPITLQALG